jgi:hypothetical protein
LKGGFEKLENWRLGCKRSVGNTLTYLRVVFVKDNELLRTMRQGKKCNKVFGGQTSNVSR